MQQDEFEKQVKVALTAQQRRLEERMGHRSGLLELLDQDRQRYRMEHPVRYRWDRIPGKLRLWSRPLHNWHARYCERQGWNQ